MDLHLLDFFLQLFSGAYDQYQYPCFCGLKKEGDVVCNTLKKKDVNDWKIFLPPRNNQSKID